MAAEAFIAENTAGSGVGSSETMNVAPSNSRYTSFAGSLAGYAGQFGLTWLNNYLAGKREQDARDWNAEQARIANQWSIDQWNRENEYNSPAAQMARLREAGINPALAYANGAFNQAASSPSVTSAAGSGQAAKVMPFQLDPMLYSNLETAAAERDLIEAQAEGIRHSTAREDEYQGTRIKLSESQIGHLDSLSNYLGELKTTVREQGEWYKMLSANEQVEYDKSMATLNSTIDAIKAQNSITIEQANTIKEQIQTMLELQRAQAHAAWQSGNASKEQVEYYKSLENYYDDALSKLTKTQIGESAARTAEASASAAHHRASAGKVEAETYWVPLNAITGSMSDAAGAARDGAIAYSEIASGKPPTTITRTRSARGSFTTKVR